MKSKVGSFEKTKDALRYNERNAKDRTDFGYCVLGSPLRYFSPRATAMHKFPDISVSVEEQENMTTDRGAMSLWVMGNTVVMDDDIEYTSCGLYTLEGVSMGVCAMTNIGEKIKIQLPENMSSGIYLLRLCDAASGKVRRIMIGK